MSGGYILPRLAATTLPLDTAGVESDPLDVAALQHRIGGGWAPRFVFFWGHSRSPGAKLGKECLSQWYPAPFKAHGHVYETAEHYMMEQKALLFGDTHAAEQIRACEHPSEVKELGRNVRGFDEDRWEENRWSIVASGSYAKFSQNPELGAFLLGTRPAVLVEASPKDRVWGIGLTEKDPDARAPQHWRGLNLLGFALMDARSRLSSIG